MASHLTWTDPTVDIHPRIWVESSTLTTYQAKILNTDIADRWESLIDWCNDHLDEGTYPNSWYENREGENVGALAFSYLIGGNTRHGRRAIALANHLASKKIPAGEKKRWWLIALALTYDYCYALLSGSQKTTLRSKIAEYCRVMKDVRDQDHLWGLCQGNVAHAIIGLIAIMADGETTDNTEWTSWMDDCMDELDDGTNNKFLPAHRWFGGTDGGTFTGSGPSSRLLESYARLFPALKSGVNWNWTTEDDWYEYLADWTLWHLRCANTLHRQHEVECEHKFARIHVAHLLQVATANAGTRGNTSLWLADLIDSVDDLAADDAFGMWHILWRPEDRATVEPTIANQGEGQMKVFSRSGKVCFRDGWGETAVSMTVSAPSYFTGGRQHRDAGHFELAAFGSPIFVAHGHFQPGQDRVPKVVGDSTETGHRWTYAARTISKNIVAIRSYNELTQNLTESGLRTLTATSAFGVETGGVIAPSNVGDQIWPKNTAGTDDRPADLTDLLAEDKWCHTTLSASMETDQMCYAVVNLKTQYWSSKVTRYRRHILWVKAGQLGTDWSYPVILIWDDIEAANDSTYGKRTTVYQLQSNVESTGDADDLVWDIGDASCQNICLIPTVEVTRLSGFKDYDGTIYPPVNEDDQSDSLTNDTESAYRTELNPTIAGTSSYLNVMFPGPGGTNFETHPSIVLIDDGTWIGATLNGVDCKVRSGNIFEAMVGSETSGEVTTTTSTTSISTTTSRSTSTTRTTLTAAPTSPEVLSVVSPARMVQKNPTLDKPSSRLNLAGAGDQSPILSGLAATFQLTLQDDEELQRWRIYSDNEFEKELTWILYDDGDDSQAEKADAKTSVVFGRDTDSGVTATRNYIEWTTNFGISRRQFYVKNAPTTGGFYIGGQICHGTEAIFDIASGSDLTLGINILPGWSDEFGNLHEYSFNRYANTFRSWGGAFTAEVFLDGDVVVSERDIADVTGWYWDNPTEGLHEIIIRLRALAGSEYLVDMTGNIRIQYV
jgi:hypothetical protein